MLFEPGYLRHGFTKSGVALGSVHWVEKLFDDIGTRDYINFSWRRHIPPENAVTGMFNRGATAEYIIEHNGITYGVTEWEWTDFEMGERFAIDLNWAQHGQTFGAAFFGNFTLEEALAFSYARPIDAWELRGDAISVSIQGMDNVRIFENSSGIAAFGSAGNEIIAIGNGLYRSGAVGFAAGGGMERVGYRWLIDEATHRYQYVLQPGAYEFRATGNNGNCQPQLLIQHFVGGERIAVTDHSAMLQGAMTIPGFSIAVTSGTEENGFMPPPAFFTTIFNEDWRPSINIRFFLDGTLTNIPLANMELVADGVLIENIRNFTLNIADWQTSQTTVFICKVRYSWQHLTFTVTYQGQTLTHHFVNNMFVPPPPPPPTHVVIRGYWGEWCGRLDTWLGCYCCASVPLKAIVYPLDANQNVIWSSDNLAVAGVDQNGLVQAAPGAQDGSTATITATAENGVVGTFGVWIHGIIIRSDSIPPDYQLDADPP